MKTIVTAVLLALLAVVLGIGIGLGFQELMNRIAKKSTPMLALRIIPSLRERARLARRIRGSSEDIGPEYAAALNDESRTSLAVIILFPVWFGTGYLMYGIGLPDILFYIAIIIELFAAVYFCTPSAEEKKNTEGRHMDNCEYGRITELSEYVTVRTRVRLFASVRLSDGNRYKLIPVINCGRGDKDKFADSECIVYRKGIGLAKCVVPKEL